MANENKKIALSLDTGKTTQNFSQALHKVIQSLSGKLPRLAIEIDTESSRKQLAALLNTVTKSLPIKEIPVTVKLDMSGTNTKNLGDQLFTNIKDIGSGFAAVNATNNVYKLLQSAGKHCRAA